MKTEEILEALDNLDLKTYPLEQAQRLISSLGKIGGEMVSVRDCFITRARMECGLKTVSDLSYNIKPSKNYGRANIPGTSVFYGCIQEENQKNMICNIVESSRLYADPDATGNEYATIGYWKVKPGKKLTLRLIIHHSSLPNVDDVELRQLKNVYTGGLENLPIEIDKADIDRKTKYLSEQFQRENTERKDYNYLITACFAHMVMGKGDCDGVVYPSVKMQETDFVKNIALLPESVDEKMELVGATEYKLIRNNKDIEGRIMRHLNVQGGRLVEL
ncbi:MAG: hypothetical protein NC324_01715 [Bacteroides sp.]|nr:hypothetical protein [Bacteroides sp.]